jgi:hypothetical protein
MSDVTISHTGTILSISASNTTAGVPITIIETSDDTDPLTSPDVTIGDLTLDTNGNGVSWSSAVVTQVNLAITPGTDGQQLLHLIFQNNVTESGKRSSNDVITLTRILPNGAVLTATRGKIVGGPRLMNQSQGGRLGTMTYQFKFARVTEGPAVLSLLG